MTGSMIWDGRSSSCRTVLIATCPAVSRWIDRADGSTALLLSPQELLEKLSALVPPPLLLIAIAATVIVLGVSAVAWGRDGLVLVALVTISGLVAFGLALGFWNWLGVGGRRSASGLLQWSVLIGIPVLVLLYLLTNKGCVEG